MNTYIICSYKELDLGLIKVRHDFQHMVPGNKKQYERSQSQANRAVCFSIKSKENEASGVGINKKTLGILCESSSGGECFN